MKIKSKVWLEKDNKLVFGQGKSALLKAIDETGSISKASRKIGISFRHGWGSITAVERRLGFKLIERSKGGKDKGGSCLTPAGRTLIHKFDNLENTANKYVDTKFKEIFTDEGRRIKNR